MQKSFTGFDDLIKVEYLLSEPRKDKNRLAILLFEYPDTTDVLQKEIIDILQKENWKVLIPIPVGDDLQAIQTLDNRKTRLSSVIQVFHDLRENDHLDSNTHTMVLGLKAMGYLIPQLSKSVKSDHHIIVNAGPHSYLYELQKLKYQEDTSYMTYPEIQQLYVRNSKDLQQKVEHVLNNSNTDITLGMNTNYDWISYYEHQTAGDYINAISDGIVLISRDYPLISSDSRIFLRALKDVNTQAPLKIVEMDGDADYTKEEEREILLEHLEDIISNFH